MPIDPKRIEAAVRAVAREHVADRGDINAIWPENLAKAALEAAFPELASDPPTVWVAPMEATDEMAVSIWDCPPDEARRAWTAMRDAHLKEKGHELKPLDADFAKVWDDNVDKLYER